MEDPPLPFRAILTTLVTIPFLTGCFASLTSAPNAVSTLPEEPLQVCVVPSAPTRPFDYRFPKLEELGAPVLINEQLLLGVTDLMMGLLMLGMM